MKPSKNSNAAENLTSLESDGGDIIMLPPKKKKEKKGTNQLAVKKQPQLSKSQKRKLKKLEEEKAKEIQLLKSYETLEKYKINDDAYSLMWSSRNLGQVETVREKRRREVHFSKAGLEMPHDEKAHPKRKRDDATENMDIEVPNNEIPLPVAEVGVLIEDMANEEEPQLPQTEETVKPMDVMDGDRNDYVERDSNGDNIIVSRDLVKPSRVYVSRPKDVEDQRMDLPIVMKEQEIMEELESEDTTSLIICGETGCGKTTQVPQFLYEYNYGSRGIIGVTQPRRVAVLATAKRVAYELGLRLGKEVGFQVRHDRKVGENCSIKFMTDGILLREVQNDFLLKRYSVIILDEAHERSLNTDILIGMLSRVIQERKRESEKQKDIRETLEPKNRIYPLKLVLMSATLRVEDFVSGNRIFRNPPCVIEVPTRQYSVTMHFSKKTEEYDYIGQAYKKVLSIHRRLPPGGILVFVTGQREVELLCKRLRRSSQEMDEKARSEASSASEEKPPETEVKEISEAFDFSGSFGHEITERFNSHVEEDDEYFSEDASDSPYDSGEESDLEFFSDGENQTKLEPEGNLSSLKAALKALTGKTVSDSSSKAQDAPQTPLGGSDQSPSLTKRKDKNTPGQLRVLPLYAMLPATSQLRVFEEGKDGERLVVVATNVAETSLTIPGIKYVVDTGREKVKNYNSSNGMESFEIQWISKASAAQRAGRAGRTGPGHCYRLYSAAAFNNLFPDFSLAEISKVPVDGVVLLLKSMHIGKVANFPFPTPPDTNALIEAERCLKVLEALDENGRLTALGRAMARYPMGPRHSRMLLTVIQIMQKAGNFARANLVLAYAVAAAAALSSSNPFLRQFEDDSEANHFEEAGSKESEKGRDKEEKSRKKQLKQSAKASREKFSSHSSDALTVAFALQCFDLSRNPIQFCFENALHYKTMEEMSKLRKQLLQLVFTSCINDPQQNFPWARGTIEDVESSWKVSSNKHPLEVNEEQILGQAICAGWADRVAKRIRKASLLTEGERNTSAVKYQACMVKETVFLHRWSCLSSTAPEFLIYSELLHSKRPYIHGATKIDPVWLPEYARALCTFSAPLSDPEPYYNAKDDRVCSWVVPTFGPHLWPLPMHGMPIKDDLTRVSVFAYALLEGQILPCLRDLDKSMAASPSILLKPEARGLKRVGNLLSGLNSRGRRIDTYAKLKKAWEENPRFLFSEIRDWFQEGFHGQFEALWKKMLRQAVSGPVKKKKVKKSKKKVQNSPFS